MSETRVPAAEFDGIRQGAITRKDLFASIVGVIHAPQSGWKITNRGHSWTRSWKCRRTQSGKKAYSGCLISLDPFYPTRVRHGFSIALLDPYSQFQADTGWNPVGLEPRRIAVTRK